MDYKSQFTGADIDARLAGVAEDFDPTKKYEIGALVIHQAQLWQKIHNSAKYVWIAADWAPTVLAAAIQSGGKGNAGGARYSDPGITEDELFVDARLAGRGGHGSAVGDGGAGIALIYYKEVG